MFVAGDLLDFLLGKRDAEYLAVLAQLRQVAVIGATAVTQAIALRVEGDGGDDREVDLRRRHDGEARVILGRNAALYA